MDYEVYARLEENLKKVKKNERMMSEAQKKQYAAVLKRYKKQIAKDFSEVAVWFLTTGLTVKVTDKKFAEELTANVQRIIEEEEKCKTEASKVLFTAYSIDDALNTLNKIRLRIEYEAYAPYWVAHCEETPEGYASEFLDGARYLEDCRIWYWDKPQIAWKCDLPPTKELCAKEYEEELVRHEERIKRIRVS